MQRGLILLAAALLPTAAPAATRSFSVTSFDRVRVEGPFAVTLRTGTGSSARAEAPDLRALDGLRIENMGRTLVIRRDRDSRSGAPLKGVRIAIATPAITGATLLGAGSLTIDTARGARFDASVSGAGALAVGKIASDLLNITITGAGNTTMSGTTHQLRAIIQGAGTIDAPGLIAQDVVLTSAGTATATLAATRSAKVNATGSGTITILGTPACTVASEGTVEISCTGPARR